MRLIQQPVLQWVNPTRNTPVGRGFMYFGVVGQDPKVPANQIMVYRKNQLNEYVEVDQPISLSDSGVPIYLGQEMALYVDQDCAIRVDDRNGYQQYLIRQYFGEQNSGSISVSGIKALGGISSPVAEIQYDVIGYYEGSTVGGGGFVYDATRSKADNNGGTVIAPEAIAAWDGTQANIAAILNWTPTGGVGCWVRVGVVVLTPAMFGAAYNGTDESLSFEKMCSSGSVCAVAEKDGLFLNSTIDIPIENITLKNIGFDINTTINAIDNRVDLFNFTGSGKVVTEDFSVIGNLEEQQYIDSAISLATYFATPTYNNGTTDIDGSDFSHVLAGNTLTVGNLVVGANQTRLVRCALIPINSAKRYCVHFPAGFMSGKNCSGVIIRLYNSSSVFTGLYNPANSASADQLQSISGASYFTIDIGVRTRANQVDNLEAVYDLTKFKLLELTNKSALLNNTNSPAYPSVFSVAGPSYVEQNGTKVKNFAGYWGNAGGALPAVANSNDIYAENILGGRIGITGVATYYKNPVLKNEFTDQNGIKYNCKWVRRDGISIGGSSVKSLIITAPNIKGMSWGIEAINTGLNVLNISDPVLDCEHTGISYGSGNNTHTSDPVIKLGAFGNYGIETTEFVVGKNSISNPQIDMSENIVNGFGIVARAKNLSITDGKITAPIPVVEASGDGENLKVSKTELIYSFVGIDCRGKNIDVDADIKPQDTTGAFTTTFGGYAASFIQTNLNISSVNLAGSIIADTLGSFCIEKHPEINVTSGVNQKYSVSSPRRVVFNAAQSATLSVTGNCYIQGVNVTGFASSSLLLGDLTGANMYLWGNSMGGIPFDFANIGVLTKKARSRDVSVTWDPPSLSAGSYATTTIFANGISVGDRVNSVGFSNSLAGCILTAQCDTANQVLCILFNRTGGTVDLASGTVTANIGA